MKIILFFALLLINQYILKKIYFFFILKTEIVIFLKNIELLIMTQHQI